MTATRGSRLRAVSPQPAAPSWSLTCRHGASSGPALRSVEVLADWVPALLDVAGVREAILVGRSMGSLVTLECAAGTHSGSAGWYCSARGAHADARHPDRPR